MVFLLRSLFSGGQINLTEGNMKKKLVPTGESNIRAEGPPIL